MDLAKLTERERLVAEQAVLTMRALEQAGEAAPWGKGMESLEAVIHDKGFEHLRTMLSLAANARPEAQKGACFRTCVACGGRGKFKVRIEKSVLSSVGHVTVARRYFACASCGDKQTPWDQWAGLLDNRALTPHARRMVTLAGTSWPFDRAEAHLLELCHLRVSDDTIERVCQEEAVRVRQWMDESPQPIESFKQAHGEAEFSTDGVKINTIDGWREMRLSVLVKRPPAAPAEPKDWDRRVLSDPTAKLAGCMIADCQRVGASWQRLSRRAGLKNAALSVIADGAKWIWDQAAKRLSGQAKWCVDVFHVSQHIHDCGKAIFGEGRAARQWADDHLMHALQHNGVGLIDRLGRERATTSNADHLRAIDRLRGYLADNRDSLWYRQRLREGLPIGSGLIEGACKNTIGVRLKANSARWRVRRAERIGALRCLDYSGHWDTYWQSKAA